MSYTPEPFVRDSWEEVGGRLINHYKGKKDSDCVLNPDHGGEGPFCSEMCWDYFQKNAPKSIHDLFEKLDK